MPTRSIRQKPRSRPPVSGTAGSSADGLSPLRPGALGSQTPTRRFAEAAIGSGSVGSRHCGSVGRRRRARHRRTTTATVAPERTALRPPLERSGGRLSRTTPPARRPGQAQTCPGPVTAGTPVRPLRRSFVRSNRAASDRPERGGRPREAVWPPSIHVDHHDDPVPSRRGLTARHGLLLTGGPTDASPGSGVETNSSMQRV